MKLGTTPTHTFELPFPIEYLSNLKITYLQEDEVILKKRLKDGTVDGNKISFKLTQEETFMFKPHVQVQIQVRVLDSAGNALSSDIYNVPAARCLDNEVLV